MTRPAVDHLRRKEAGNGNGLRPAAADGPAVAAPRSPSGRARAVRQFGPPPGTLTRDLPCKGFQGRLVPQDRKACDGPSIAVLGVPRPDWTTSGSGHDVPTGHRST